MSARHLLCLNSGSSSLKFAVFAESDASQADLQPILAGAAEHLGASGGKLRWKRESDPSSRTEDNTLSNSKAALEAIMALLARERIPAPAAVGHRLVHGGPEHFEPERVTDALRKTLEGCIPFAPLHLPAELQGIDAIRALQPHTAQVVCFDTAFHRRLPEVAQRYPLPTEVVRQGVRRYGFHGISCQYIVQHLGPSLRERTVVAHLGSGSSLTAILRGASFDTSMGLTPTGGVMMGTRSGDLDPGVVLYLARQNGDLRALEHTLNHASGLLGVSETTADMQQLVARRADDSRARLAVEMFCYQVKKEIGALTAALGGIEQLVFAGGVGEHAPMIRAEICLGLEHLGIRLSPELNQQNAPQIHSPESTVEVRIVETNEDLVIAQATAQLALAG